MKCPVCDSSKTKIEKSSCTIRIKYCKPIKVPTKTCICETCKEEIDISNNDSFVEKSMIKVKIEAIPKLIKHLEKLGYSQPNIKRVFGISYTCLFEHLDTDITFAFLSILCNYPHIINETDNPCICIIKEGSFGVNPKCKIHGKKLPL